MAIRPEIKNPASGVIDLRVFSFVVICDISSWIPSVSAPAGPAVSIVVN
jgi:hypothetical protein